MLSSVVPAHLTSRVVQTLSRGSGVGIGELFRKLSEEILHEAPRTSVGFLLRRGHLVVGGRTRARLGMTAGGIRTR